jgi:hypothetical protein
MKKYKKALLLLFVVIYCPIIVYGMEQNEQTREEQAQEIFKTIDETDFWRTGLFRSSFFKLGPGPVERAKNDNKHDWRLYCADINFFKLKLLRNAEIRFYNKETRERRDYGGGIPAGSNLEDFLEPEVYRQRTFFFKNISAVIAGFAITTGAVGSLCYKYGLGTLLWNKFISTKG